MSLKTTPAVRLEGVRLSFGPTPVLDGVSLTVAEGEVLVLLGASGSGKTTLLRVLAGLEWPSAGRIRIEDVEVDAATTPPRRGRDALRSRTAMVFQQHNLFPHRTVLGNVIEGPVSVQRRSRADAEQEARRLLDRVGLGERADAYPAELSGGQQQRVGIVRALALHPRVLLFDEPTSSLDPELVGEVLTVMSELAAEGWTMIVVTHELGFARAVADSIAFLDGGTIVEHAPSADFFAAPRTDRARRFLARLDGGFHP
ncbi:amino acid ABC transporter ATP-binding protein [Mycetocola reblochoni]|uniref:Amino acid ABC transporter, ATP-binding protein n=2 Tax=Mycetocola reblochoni TaxID=331618 RepID=A0A1R4J2X4_9MICO|nr:amino acid ABC transporter ATP-binding protein [Mycetocola reblochoni]RLP69482.1 amino acid ABC transporter ATP-binding protein [Mycetocola reblochoni]SJN26426.1 Amino acid ABC transporter, ATP-binding protein [Mycetocola reblochoni REB411]